MNKEQAYLSIINATIRTLNECIQRMNRFSRQKLFSNSSSFF